MKTAKVGGLGATLLFTFLCTSALADTPTTNGNVVRADAHAPAGVMLDHMHHAGEVMIGYRLNKCEHNAQTSQTSLARNDGLTSLLHV